MKLDLERIAAGLFIGTVICLLAFALHKGETSAKKDAAPPVVAARKLLYFGGSWCLPCKKMATTLSDPKVVKAMLDTRTPLTKYDVDKDRDLAARHAVKSVPTYLILDGSGKEIRRATGYKSAADFAAWLTP